MKKLIILGLLILFLVGCTANAVQEIDYVEKTTTDCPSGMYNDPAPGACGQFVDTDGNRICDLSE